MVFIAENTQVAFNNGISKCVNSSWAIKEQYIPEQVTIVTIVLTVAGVAPKTLHQCLKNLKLKENFTNNIQRPSEA